MRMQPRKIIWRNGAWSTTSAWDSIIWRNGEHLGLNAACVLNANIHSVWQLNERDDPQFWNPVDLKAQQPFKQEHKPQADHYPEVW